MMFYTYMHRRASDGSPFYIGKGKRRDRMTLASGRSEHWTRIASKHGFKAEVVAKWKTEAEAFEHEKFLIWCFRDMGFSICNHTDGGEGASGFKQSDATKALRNGKLRGRPKSAETIARMRVAQANKTIPDYAREQIAATLRGRFVGGKNPNAKPVRCLETGVVFASMVDAASWLQSIGHPKASFKSIHAAASGSKKTAYGYAWGRA